MSRYELDPQHPEMIPAPQMGSHIAKEIEGLLPRNLFGEPQLICEWGMSATCWRNEDPKAIKYVALHHVVKTTTWRRLDPIAGEYETFATRKEAVEALNIRLLPHLEHKTTRQTIIYGPPRWFVSQWFPAEKIDTRKNWDRNRYQTYKNRRGEQVKLDALGPYPARGQYREVFMVEGLEGEFRDLDAGVLFEIRRRLAERELYDHNQHSDGQAIRDTIAEEQAKVALTEKLIEDEFEAEIGVSRYRLIEGNAWSGYGGTQAQAAGALLKP
jgi:hypothetical protein